MANHNQFRPGRSRGRRDRRPARPSRLQIAGRALTPNSSQDLAAIQYAGCAIVCLAYRRDQFGTPPDGFGFVVPKIEHRQITRRQLRQREVSGRCAAR